MAPSRRILIPKIFNYLLPAQGIVAAVVIYSSVYIFGVGRIPFILAVSAAGIHFLLGIYFCITQGRPGMYHAYIVPVWLLCGAGVWCGTLYYFVRHIEVINSVSQSFWDRRNKPLAPTWTKVGCAASGLNVLIDLFLLGWFIVSVVKQKSQSFQSSAFISAPVNAAPHMNSQNYPPLQPHYQQQQQQQQPLFQPQFQPQFQQHIQFPTAPADFKTAHPVVAAPAPTAPSPPGQQRPPVYPYDRGNRIDVIRRLCALQHLDGHWDYGPELAELVKLWGGRELMSPAHGVTALTHACMMDLCSYVWGAQRDGREYESLSSAELASLQAVNWNLSWAQNAMDRATAWMGGYR